MKTIYRAVSSTTWMIIFCGALLSGCGHKGELILPQPTKQQTNLTVTSNTVNYTNF